MVFLVGVSVLAVEVALSDATPGPALTAVWRWIVAALTSLLALSGWAIVHAHRATREPSDEPNTFGRRW